MRSVNRQTVACPEILTGPESRQSQYELVEYFMLPKNERRQLRPPINREIPFHETVKDSLLNLFSGKCAFCESPIAGSLEIDIEHFRPLANAQNLSQKNRVLTITAGSPTSGETCFLRALGVTAPNAHFSQFVAQGQIFFRLGMMQKEMKRHSC